MKKPFMLLLFTLALSTAISAANYPILNDTHTRYGCTYYDITIWDDNGTPEDRSDDFKESREWYCKRLPG